MSYVGTKPGATVPPAAGMVKSDGVVLQTAVPNTDYLPAANPTFTGDLTAGGIGQRIKGDFSNATLANRVLFQTTQTNGPSYLSVIPNGSSADGGVYAWGKSSDFNNSPYAGIIINATVAAIDVGRTGTGTQLPLVFSVGNLERMRIDPTTGNVGVGTSPAADKTLINQTNDAPTLKLTSNQSGYLSSNQSVFRTETTNGTSAPTSSYAISCSYNSSIVFSVRHDGLVEGTNIVANMAKKVPFSSNATAGLVASDTGKVIAMTQTLTVSANIFTAGDIVTVVNLSGSQWSLVQGSGMTLYAPGFSTGNRTMPANSIATILFYSPVIAVVTGAGFS